jgi:protocatechuate 3,4-dioxygenase beta subunit
VVPWNPVHVAGPDRGTTACPVCTYQERPAVLIFVRDGEDAAELARQLQTLVNTFRKRELKGFVVVLDSTPERLKRMARELGIAEIALCYPEPETRAEALREYRIHPAAKNTVLVYKDYVVAASFTDLDAKDFGRVAAVVRKTLR